MIPNFYDYFLIRESKSLSDLAKGNARNLSYGQIKRNFIGKGYDFLGTIYMEEKGSGTYKTEEITNAIPEDILAKVDKYGYKAGYISKRLEDVRYLSISIDSDSTEIYNRFHEVLGEPNIDKITSCFTQKQKLYYVLWNEEKKYFYFMRLENRGYLYSSGDHLLAFAELWVKVRTSGVDTVRQEVEDFYDRYAEEDRVKAEEMENERKAKAEADAHAKAVQAGYDKRSEAVQADAEANPDSYVEVEYEDLPDDVKADIENEDKENVKYVEYIEHGRRDPYDVETATVYVNDDALSRGYKFKRTIDHSKRGTYWGD